MKPSENRPNTLWPIGSRVEFLDAWGRNPVLGAILRHVGAVEVLVEDGRGVRHCGQTWRIATEPEPPGSPFDTMFEDLLG